MPRDDTMRGLAHERDHLRTRAEAAERALAEERAHSERLAKHLSGWCDAEECLCEHDEDQTMRCLLCASEDVLDAHRARRAQKPAESAHVDGTCAGDAHDEGGGK